MITLELVNVVAESEPGAAANISEFLLIGCWNFICLSNALVIRRGGGERTGAAGG